MDNDTLGKINESNSAKQSNRTELRCSNRERKVLARYNDDYVYNNYVYVNVCSADSPENFEEAINSNESDSWKQQAMSNEIECLIKNKTWKLVNRPDNKKILNVNGFIPRNRKMYIKQG